MESEKVTIAVEGCTNAKEVYSKLHEQTLILIDIHEKIYGCKPKYIKIPLGVYKILKHYYYSFFENNIVENYCGLKLCPTITIQSINQIEVF